MSKTVLLALASWYTNYDLEKGKKGNSKDNREKSC